MHPWQVHTRVDSKETVIVVSISEPSKRQIGSCTTDAADKVSEKNNVSLYEQTPISFTETTMKLILIRSFVRARLPLARIP